MAPSDGDPTIYDFLSRITLSNFSAIRMRPVIVILLWLTEIYEYAQRKFGFDHTETKQNVANKSAKKHSSTDFGELLTASGEYFNHNLNIFKKPKKKLIQRARLDRGCILRRGRHKGQKMFLRVPHGIIICIRDKTPLKKRILQKLFSAPVL